MPPIQRVVSTLASLLIDPKRTLPFLLAIVSVCGLQAADPNGTWPGWRGENRDGHTAKLPKAWSEAQLLWQAPLISNGVGGIAADRNFVIVSGRDATDKRDRFVCLEPISGAVLWELDYAAPHELDYGNSPRATPTIHDPYVFLLGAGGHLNCVDIDSGEVRWKKEFVSDLHGELPEWGYANSPIVVGKHLVVQPGGKAQSIVALDLETGTTVWMARADQTAYASPQFLRNNRGTDVLLVDRSSYFAIDGQSGKTLWKITSKGASEFRVPMPIVLNEAIVTSGEVHGTRRFEFDKTGGISSEPSAEQLDLAPDTQSLVANKHWIIGIQNDLLALHPKNLEVTWRIQDPAFSNHCSLLMSDDRMLAITEEGEAILIDASAKQISDPQLRILGRQSLSDDQSNCLAHPAIVGGTLYVRTSNAISAWSLSD